MYSNISITSLVSPSATGRGSSPARALLTAAAISIGWTILLCSAFDPRWESNDDVTMSMVAHGYGIASYGSDLLFFSNVLWGSFVRSLPMIDGILGYSIATLLSMTLASGGRILQEIWSWMMRSFFHGGVINLRGHRLD